MKDYRLWGLGGCCPYPLQEVVDSLTIILFGNWILYMMDIDGRLIGEDNAPFIIAEIGINHEGDVDRAEQMVRDAAESGAECVKFQMHVLESEMINNDVVPGNTDNTISNIMRRCSLTREEHEYLKDLTEELGMTYLCTPFSRQAADILEDMGVSAFKIGSGECNNYPLVEHIASFDKPVILSTGMNDLESIERSVEILRENGNAFSLLQCTSMYPTPYEKVNLGAMDELKEHFEPDAIGLSDHSKGISVSLGATGKGANIIEKHFISDKNWPGPDVPVSINPEELEDLIRGANQIFKAQGGSKQIVDGEESTIKFAYASAVSIDDIEAGEELNKDNIWVKRPGTGDIQADDFYKLLGRRAAKDIAADTQLDWDMIEDE